MFHLDWFYCILIVDNKGVEGLKMSEKSNDITQKPISTKGDKVHRAVRTIISLVPGFGGAGVELFNQIIAPPLEKRRDDWVESLAQELTKLREQVDGFSYEELSQNDEFIMQQC